MADELTLSIRLEDDGGDLPDRPPAAPPRPPAPTPVPAPPVPVRMPEPVPTPVPPPAAPAPILKPGMTGGPQASPTPKGMASVDWTKVPSARDVWAEKAQPVAQPAPVRMPVPTRIDVSEPVPAFAHQAAAKVEPIPMPEVNRLATAIDRLAGAIPAFDFVKPPEPTPQPAAPVPTATPRMELPPAERPRPQPTPRPEPPAPTRQAPRPEPTAGERRQAQAMNDMAGWKDFKAPAEPPEWRERWSPEPPPKVKDVRDRLGEKTKEMAAQKGNWAGKAAEMARATGFGRAAPAIEAVGGAAGGAMGGAMAAAGPAAAALLIADQTGKAVASVFRGAAEAAQHLGGAMKSLAQNDNLGAVTKTADMAASALEKIPIAGQVWGAAIRTVTATARAFSETVEAFVARGAELAQYHGGLAGANARAEVTSVLGDIREAQELGPSLERLTDGWTDLTDMVRELLLPIKKFVTETLADAVEGLTDYKDEMKAALDVVLANLKAVVAMATQLLKAVLWIAEKLGLVADHTKEKNDRDAKRDAKKDSKASDLFEQMLLEMQKSFADLPALGPDPVAGAGRPASFIPGGL